MTLAQHSAPWALLLAVTVGCPRAHASHCAEPADLQWLEGLWLAYSAGAEIYEEWQSRAHDVLEGQGKTTRDHGELVSEERLRIEARDGRLVYVADVSSNPEPVVFTLVNCNAGRWTFENPEHDFPQRIVYTRDGERRFTANIMNLDGRGFELSFQRLKKSND